jgi:hypothetical protein
LQENKTAVIISRGLVKGTADPGVAMIPDGFQELISRNNIVATIVTLLDSGEKVTLGDRTKLQSDFIVRTLFDDLTVEEIDAFLKGRLLPCMVQQGKVCGIVCKPNEKTIVGIYYHDERDVRQRYNVSKKLDAELRQLFSHPGT